MTIFYYIKNNSALISKFKLILPGVWNSGSTNGISFIWSQLDIWTAVVSNLTLVCDVMSAVSENVLFVSLNEIWTSDVSIINVFDVKTP